jgi:outer membrane protein OmpA-like peptidoglycan-associated protein
MRLFFVSFCFVALASVSATATEYVQLRPQVEVDLSVLDAHRPAQRPVKQTVPAPVVAQPMQVESVPLAPPAALEKKPTLLKPLFSAPVALQELVNAANAQTLLPMLPKPRPDSFVIVSKTPGILPQPRPSSVEPAIITSAEITPLEPEIMTDTVIVLFDNNSSALNDSAQQTVLGLIPQLLGKAAQSRFRIVGYATGEDGAKDSARRISLSRALIVRRFLMDHGINPAAIDVQALGAESETAPLDRVDIVLK